MCKAFLLFELSLNAKTIAICTVSLVLGFCTKHLWATLKHLKWLPWKPKVSCDQTLDKLSEKVNSKLLVQEEHGFQKGAQCAPLWQQELQKKKSPAWIGLQLVPNDSYSDKKSHSTLLSTQQCKVVLMLTHMSISRGIDCIRREICTQALPFGSVLMKFTLPEK